MPKLLATQSEIMSAASIWLTINRGETVATNEISITAIGKSKCSDLPLIFLCSADDGIGWVIVSCDKQVMPVLAGSADGTFEPSDSPDFGPNLLIDDWINQIDELHNSDAAVVEGGKYNLIWTALLAATLEAPVLEVVADEQFLVGDYAYRWAQSSPFNDNCPLVNGVRSLVGCVGVATAMILAYYNRDEGAAGETIERGGPDIISYYHYDIDQLVTNYAIETEFDITSFGLTAATCTDEQSAFMYLCACAVQTSFGSSLSTAYPTDLVWAYPTYLRGQRGIDGSDVSNSPKYKVKSQYSEAGWEALLIASLDENSGPILYSGRGPTGAHSFVLDGYGVDGVSNVNWFHFVFGWGNTGVGWYQIGNIQPTPTRSYNSLNAIVHYFAHEYNHVVSNISDGDVDITLDVDVDLNDNEADHAATIDVQVVRVPISDADHPFGNLNQISWLDLHHEETFAHDVGTFSLKNLQNNSVYAMRCKYDTDDGWREVVRFKTVSLAIL